MVGDIYSQEHRNRGLLDCDKVEKYLVRHFFGFRGFGTHSCVMTGLEKSLLLLFLLVHF